MQKIQVYPHNDLLNLAYFQRNSIKKKLEDPESEGIKLDCLACLISLAFSVEAIVNFVGHKKIDNWKEKDHFRQKND